jgi:hypothetical protein
MIMPALMYSAIAIDFVWLGIGSLMARRWARTLLAIQSWTAFVWGLLALCFIAILAPTMKQAVATATPPNQPPLSDAAQTGMLIAVFSFCGFFFVVLPLVWALFYSGRNVKATSEALDPAPRWTDRCPTPVLAASFWLAFGALGMLATTAYGVAPFFGILLSGILARVFYLVVAAIWVYCAWALYRLDRRGWWIICAALVLFALSTLATFLRHDLSEMYTSMGYSADYVAKLRAFSDSRFTVWSTLVWTILSLGYLLYIRRFFAASDSASSQKAAAAPPA